MVIPAKQSEPEPRAHEGYEWLYVLSGRMRLVHGDHDLVLSAGEVAEFDTRLPHWFGSADGNTTEVLSLFDRQGEGAHVRAKSERRKGSGPRSVGGNSRSRPTAFEGHPAPTSHY